MTNNKPYRIIGNPENFDLSYEEDRFRFGRVVIEKQNGQLLNHYYDHSPWKFDAKNSKAVSFIKQIERADTSLVFQIFNQLKFILLMSTES